MPSPAITFDREDLPFPGSLPEFQRLFPNDAACAAYLEAIRWRQGFVCMWCGERGEPFRFANRPHVLRFIRAVGTTLTVVVMGENRISTEGTIEL